MRHADADRQRQQRAVGERHRRRADRARAGPAARWTATPAAAGQQDGELVAAQPGQDGVLGADLAARAPSRGAPGRVAHRVAVRVVDRLERVDVDEHERGPARDRARVSVVASAPSKARRVTRPVSESTAEPAPAGRATSRSCMPFARVSITAMTTRTAPKKTESVTRRRRGQQEEEGHGVGRARRNAGHEDDPGARAGARRPRRPGRRRRPARPRRCPGSAGSACRSGRRCRWRRTPLTPSRSSRRGRDDRAGERRGEQAQRRRPSGRRG